jgi:hypothetical protein
MGNEAKARTACTLRGIILYRVDLAYLQITGKIVRRKMNISKEIGQMTTGPYGRVGELLRVLSRELLTGQLGHII